MQEQQDVGKARMIGYAIGIAAAAAVILWKLVVR
jgi:hypothetical protein